MWWDKYQCQSALVTLLLSKSLLLLMHTNCGLPIDADCVVAHGVIIDYACKCGCVVIKDNETPFTLMNGVATIPDLLMCSRIISALNAITISDCSYLMSAYQMKQS